MATGASVVVVTALCYDVQSKLSQLQQLQQKTEMELLDARMFSASLENELDDEDASGIHSLLIVE